ncbi:UNVERIFIED_CONTAM: hypothetical protein FKN15_057065 [Acipenser sinensis]
MPPLVCSTHGLFGHLPPYSLKSRLGVRAQEQGKQGVSGGGHGGMSSSHPNNCSVPVDHAQAGSSGQKKFGGGLQTCPPYFMAGSSPPWGSGHPFSCSEIAAGGAGLLTSPPSSWLAAALHGAPATVFPAGGAGFLTSPPFFVAGNCPSWGSSHSISCRESAAGGAGLLTTPPFSVAGSSPSWGFSISCRMAGLVVTPGKTGPSGGDSSSCRPTAGSSSGPSGGNGSCSGPSGGDGSHPSNLVFAQHTPLKLLVSLSLKNKTHMSGAAPLAGSGKMPHISLIFYFN